jgi:hypothetical protein
MSASTKLIKPFTALFDENGANLRLALTNTTDQRLREVEVLTIFLRDEDTPGGGPSRAHLKFETVNLVLPNEQVLLSHRTWIDGSPAGPEMDQLERLRAAVADGNRYILDISWQDPYGKSQFQRIPIGH